MINYPEGLSESEIGLYIAAFKKCRELIKEKNNKVTADEIIDEVAGRWGSVVNDEIKLRAFLKAEVKIPVDPVHIMVDKTVKDSKWFYNYKKENGHHMEYWRRYYDYLNQKPSWSLDAITDIDESTDAVVNFLANPSIEKKQDIRGLAFGYVQSGKTAHYLGVINKAVDAGYKIIIILAGIHNNLRSQTQIRLEEEVLGYDVNGTLGSEENILGVGKMSDVSHHLQALTSRDEKGDFNKIKAGTSVNPPLVVVTKKNASVLNRLIKYLKDIPISVTNDEGKKVIPMKYPALIIDDEADQASLNTKDCYNADGTLKEDFDPTKINGCIRRLLGLFECNAYIGYTATPFANIFIPPKVTNFKYGDDLFPRDFIVNIPRSSMYIGALEFFGLSDDETQIKSMPLFREIVKGKDYLGKGTKKDDLVGEIPDDLKTAIKTFVVSVAVRNLRGQRYKPNSMLIHIVRYKGQQNTIKRKVEAYFTEEFYNYIVNADPEVEDGLRIIWENDFRATTDEMRKDFGKYMKDVPDFLWDDVYTEIRRYIKAKEFTIYSINGDSDDVLIYDSHKDEPFNVIVIGGDKLARGLTLEGLMVSYFTRSSNTYDTLMQMGRWFGYRPGYIDLCRLFATKELHGFFVDISRATEDLVKQINYMCDVVKQNPSVFGLGVESNPDLLITSRDKMRTGKEMKRDFSAHLSQTRMIDIDPDQYDENFNAVENLLYSIGAHATEEELTNRDIKRVGQHVYWLNVLGQDVSQFLREYKTSASASRANSIYMADYIANQNECQGLTNWTVCLINVKIITKPPIKIAGLSIGAGVHRDSAECTDGGSVCDVHVLTSDGHEYLDYTTTQFNKLDELKNQGKHNPDLRKGTRNRKDGLLILYPLGDVEPLTRVDVIKGHKTPFGFAIVFPDRQDQGTIKSYRINNIAVEKKSYDFDA
jgi:hypothetical protein